MDVRTISPADRIVPARDQVLAIDRLDPHGRALAMARGPVDQRLGQADPIDQPDLLVLALVMAATDLGDPEPVVIDQADLGLAVTDPAGPVAVMEVIDLVDLIDLAAPEAVTAVIVPTDQADLVDQEMVMEAVDPADREMATVVQADLVMEVADHHGSEAIGPTDPIDRGVLEGGGGTVRALAAYAIVGHVPVAPATAWATGTTATPIDALGGAIGVTRCATTGGTTTTTTTGSTPAGGTTITTTLVAGTMAIASTAIPTRIGGRCQHSVR